MFSEQQYPRFGAEPLGLNGVRRWMAPLVVGLSAVWGSEVAQAEALRCGGTSIGPGDSRLQVARLCGEPTLKDSYCAPVSVGSAGMARGAVPGQAAVVVNVLPCQTVDEWLYERGPGDLPAVVRIHNGVVTSIGYGRDTPRSPGR